MGNTDSVVVQQRLARFRLEERPVVEGLFEKLQQGSSSVATGKTKTFLELDTLKHAMADVASEQMVRRVYAAMASMSTGAAAGSGEATGTAAEAGVSHGQLLVFLADVLRGTAEERAPIVMVMAGGSQTGVVTCDQVSEFLQDLVTAVVQILTRRGRLKGWEPDHMGDCSLGVKLLAEQMCSELKPSDGVCNVSVLEDWIFHVSQVAVYLDLLISEGLGVALSSQPPPPLLPPCQVAPWGKLRCLLDLPSLMFLTPQLPEGLSSPWRLLFSTQLHGESFSRVVGSCQRKGPSLLLVRDTKGHVFGGFASQSWEIKPQFQGDSRCFLFSVFPSLRVYTCTGYNDHYMYLNQGQQTMPNGLGMGGQHGYFGLWLDSDFGRGHSRARPRCTTYGSPQLSGEEDFILDQLEIWAVGKPPQDPDQEKRSILDVDPEAQALMEIVGKTMHSQGLREPDDQS
ncbi:MTOR-associated protein MEAK7 [Osmerus eperlanus]|uniref:MTOR-associated protein MEAK7 n=1 Tax=Osmerus eperlanus TaxID=29151 RepID=UPI002E11842D